MIQRIITGLILVAAAALLIGFGGLTLGVGVMICLLYAVYEETKAMQTAGHHVVTWPTWILSVIGLPMIVFLGDKVVMPMVMLASLAIIITVVFRRQPPELLDVMMSILPLFSVVLPCMGVMCVSRILPVELQRMLMCMILVVPILGDTLAYFVGSKVRGPKLCPAISPNKTISGAIAGLVGSVLGAVLVGAAAYAFSPQVAERAIPGWWTILGIGLAGGVASQMGDLFASLIKRHAGIKDFSNLFPGHGGMMDRLDSIMFMALVIYSIRLLV